MNIEQPRSISLLAQTVLCAVAVVCLLYIPIPILPFLAQHYHLQAGQEGLALSVFSAAYASGYLLFGGLSDRFGRKVVVVAGLLVLTVITLLMVWLHETAVSWPGFVLLRALQGWAASVFPPAALVYVAGRGNAHQRMWAVTWMGAAFFSSGLLGQIYGLQIVVPLGLGWALCILAAIYVLTALRFLFIKEETQAVQGQTLQANTGLGGRLSDNCRAVFALLVHGDLWRIYATALLMLFCFVAFYLALDTHLGELMARHGISRLQMRLVALPVFLIPLCAPKMMAWFGVQRVLVMGLSCAALGLLACAVLVLFEPFWVLAGSIVFVAGIALTVPGLNLRVVTVSAPQVRAKATALYAFTLFVGTSFAPGFNQLVRTLPLALVLLILALILLVAVYCNLRVPDPARNQAE